MSSQPDWPCNLFGRLRDRAPGLPGDILDLGFGREGIRGHRNRLSVAQSPFCQVRPRGFIEVQPVPAMDNHDEAMRCSTWKKQIQLLARALTVEHIHLGPIGFLAKCRSPRGPNRRITHTVLYIGAIGKGVVPVDPGFIIHHLSLRLAKRLTGTKFDPDALELSTSPGTADPSW